MKIACVQTFPRDYCIDYVNAIKSLGEVSLLAAERQMRDHVSFVDSEIDTVLLPWPRHRSPKNLYLMYRLRREIQTRNPDIGHFLGASVSWLSLVPSMIGRRPVLVTIHDAVKHPGDTNSSILPNVVGELFYRQADRLVFHGESIRTLFAKQNKRHALDASDIVPHPALRRYAEVARRENLPPRATTSHFRMLFFGRIMAYKGLQYLLDAFEMLNESAPTCELVIAGKGPGYDDVAGRLDSPMIKLYCDFVPDVEVARLFMQTDLVVLPYTEASQSGILAIAAAFGRAVLVADVGELGEITRKTGMGLIVPPRDGQAIANAVSRLRSNPPLKAELEAKSAEAAEIGALSQSAVAKAAEDAYRRAIEALSP